MDADPASPTQDGTPATLIVGATGILRPAAFTLLGYGMPVLAVGRDPRRIADLACELRGTPADLEVLRADAKSNEFVAAVSDALTGRGWELGQALLYGPAISPTLIPRLVDRFDPLIVDILTSSTAEPPAGSAEWSLANLPPAQSPKHRRLVLGWTRVQGESAWHTPEQVSAGALGALELPGDRVLGRVHPWPDRPTSRTSS